MEAIVIRSKALLKATSTTLLLAFQALAESVTPSAPTCYRSRILTNKHRAHVRPESVLVTMTAQNPGHMVIYGYAGKFL